MTPRLLLLYVTAAIVVFDMATVRFRERNASNLEGRVMDLLRRNGGRVTAAQVSEELEIPLYDAKILMRKYVSKGKIEVSAHEGEETYRLIS